MKKILIIIILTILIVPLLLNKKKKDITKFNIFENVPLYKKELLKEYNDYYIKTNYPIEKVIMHVNIGLNKPFYEGSTPSKYLNTNYILVNKYNYLDKNYIPNDLVILDKFSKPGIKLNKEAYDNFIKMANDAKNNNLNLRIISAYRSYEYQEKLYNNYLKYDTKEVVDTYSARPGYSEHQTGLVIDIDNIKKNYNYFHLTEEYSWMQNNAYKYGFILRYPRGKEMITGYKYESWHYRYVGNNISKYIHENNITFEEYYYKFIDK